MQHRHTFDSHQSESRLAMPEVDAWMTSLLAMDTVTKRPGDFRTTAQMEFEESKEFAKLIKE